MKRHPLYRRWTAEELAELKQLWAKELPKRIIAARLRRTISGIDAKAKKLGLVSSRGQATLH